MIIGFDDTDSRERMCTTYLMAVLIEDLCNLGNIRGLPHLVRLNPNIRYKTRGNAALAVEIEPFSGCEGRIIEISLSLLEEMADFQCQNTNPGIVFINDADTQGLKKDLEEFLWRAVRDVLEVEDALDIIDRYDLNHRGFKNQRGLIGALAACGAVLCGLPDLTYELIVYRRAENFGTPRNVDRDSVFEADMLTYPLTWDTVDIANDTVVFSPRSPDPVLFGIRGDSIDAIERAFRVIRSEPVGKKMLYVTNQGTDMHLLDSEIEDIKDLRSYRLKGIVVDNPRTIRGGHVFFTIEGSGRIECAAFEPTKGFRNIVCGLVPGDKVKVYGSVQNETLNLEKLDILKLARHEKAVNPTCPICNRRMKSKGHLQGYRCRSCRTENPHPETIILERKVESGIYEVPPSARRHISKPLIRLNDNRAFPSR